MIIEEKREEDFERAFKELYVEPYVWPRRTRELKEQPKAINKERDVLE